MAKIVNMPEDAAKAGARADQRRKQKKAAALGNGQQANDPNSPDKPRIPQAQQIVTLIDGNPDITLWHDTEGEGYITIAVDDHFENMALKSRAFRLLLSGMFCEENDNRPPNSTAVKDALAALEYQALKGEEFTTFIRVAYANGRIYIDLGDPTWRAVEITHEGWKIIDNPPVKFTRTRHMMPLPEPQRGGNIQLLRPLVNTSDEGFTLIVGFMLKCLYTPGGDPILAVSGDQGSGKTFQCKQIKNLIDPSVAETRSAPKEPKDLYVSAQNSHLLLYDNLSYISNDLSDAFCSLSTGNAYAARKLFTDGEEHISKAKRPVIINAIADIGAQPDFMDRSVSVKFNAIDDTARRPEKELLEEFEHIKPLVLGALYDMAAHGLANIEQVKLDRLPRLADFAEWATACEPEEKRGKFVRLIFANRDEVRGDALAADPVGQAIVALIEIQNEWKGTATDLLNRLDNIPDIPHGKHWPSDARALSQRLRRIKPLLEKRIAVEEKRTASVREIFLTKLPSLPSFSVTASSIIPQINDANDNHDTNDATKILNNFIYGEI